MSPTSFQTAPSRDKCYLLKRRMGRGGFEPPKQVAADLQSVPFGHSGICPFITKQYKIDLLHSSITWIVKADDRTRTDNLLITNQLLCQLSHIGISWTWCSNDPNEIRTRVTAVKGRCLNRLTMGPDNLVSMDLNSPSRTWTYDSAVNSRVLYRLSYRGLAVSQRATRVLYDISMHLSTLFSKSF